MRNSIRYGALVASVMVLAAACSSEGAEAEPGTTTTTTSPAPVTTAAPTTTTSTVTTVAAADPEIPPVVVWTDRTSVAVLVEAAEAFTARTGIPVEVTAKDVNSIRTEIADSPTPPDAFLGKHTWTDGLLAAELIAPTDIDIVSNSFLPISLDAFTRNAELFAVPAGMELHALYRNTDLVPDLPEKTDGIKEACAAVEDRTRGCFGFPADDPIAGYAFLAAFDGYALGFDEGSRPEDVGFHRLEALAGAEWFNEQVEIGFIDSTLGGVEAAGWFNGGSLPFLWAPPSHAARVPSTVPFEVTSYPTLDGEIPIPLIDVWGYFLSAQAQQPIPALTFLAEYLAVEETLMQWSLAVGMPPAHRDAHARLDDVDPVLGGFQLPSEAVPSTHLTPAGPQGEEALAVIEWVLEILLTQGYDDILLDPAAVMDEAADRIRALVGADA